MTTIFMMDIPLLCRRKVAGRGPRSRARPVARIRATPQWGFAAWDAGVARQPEKLSSSVEVVTQTVAGGGVWPTMRRSPGAGGRRAVAVQDFGAVGAAGGGGAVGVQGDGPGPMMDRDVVVKEAIQRAAVHAGLPAVGQVGHVVDLTG